MSQGDGGMIYYVNADGSIIGGTDSNDLDGITSLCGGAYIVQIADTTVSSTMNGTTNVTPQIQNLTPTGDTNKFGLPIATGTLATVAIASATMVAAQRQAISDKYDPQIATARENLRKATDERKPQTTIDHYYSTLQTLLTNKNNELAGVH